MPKLCGMLPVIGTIVAIGPTAADDGDTTYQHLAIREKGGRMRHFTIVRAIADLAALIEPHAIGIFLFWEQELGERRLCYVYRADGPRQVDFEAVRAYLEAANLRRP
jgi:hypothetical protein